MKRTAIILEEDGVVRVDKYLAYKFPEYSRAAITKLFDLKLIKLKGEPIQPGHKLRPGTSFEYDLGPLQAKPEVIELPIIYEDNDVIVVNKPAGIISHARGKFWQEASVASFIRDKIKDMEGERGGIVHRLDRATSGIMICAKNEVALRFLQKQFSERKVQKTYLAITANRPSIPEAIIEAAIARDERDPKRFMVSSSGKHAETYYKLVKESDNAFQLELTPKTGRTHQLRVHMAYIGCPIIGDNMYGGEPHDRLLLHAFNLRIRLPGGKISNFTAPLPDEFREYLK